MKIAIKDIINKLQDIEQNNKYLTDNQLIKINYILEDEKLLADINALDEWFNLIALPEVAKKVIKLYLYKSPQSIKVFKSIFDMRKNNKPLISLSAKSGIINIGERINNLLDNDPELIDFLTTLSLKSRVDIGPYEILLTVLGTNGRYNNGNKSGDIVIDIDGIPRPVEIKKNTGRCGGVNAGIASHKSAMTHIKNEIISYYKQLVNVNTTAFVEKVQNAGSFIITATTKASFEKSLDYYLLSLLKNNPTAEQYSNLAINVFRKILLGLFANPDEVINDIDKLIEEFVGFDISVGRLIKEPKTFMALFKTIYLKLYQKHEGFNHLLVINDKTNDIVCLDLSDIQNMTPADIAARLEMNNLELKTMTISNEARQGIAPSFMLK